MATRRRIAIYSHSIAPSIDGVCRRFTGLLKEMVSRGHEVILFTLEDHPEDLPDLLACVTLDHMFVPSYPDKKVARPTARTASRVWNTLRTYKPEVVHVTADGFSHLFAMIGLLLGIPVVGSFHTDLIDLLQSHQAHNVQCQVVAFKERMDCKVLDNCATTSLSFAAKLKLQGVVCEHIIQTAVDTDTFNADKKVPALRREMTFGDDNAFLCLYVGRISKEKRIDVIWDAVRHVDGAYLAIVGDGPSAAHYAALHSKDRRIYCKPRFLSHAELAAFYASSDLHVSASQFETLGNTVLEAFACGVPVVVPRTQGFQDTVRHEETGFLFEPGDSASAQRFVTLLKTDVARRRAMGQAGRLQVSKQTISHVVSDLLDWYDRGVAARRRRGVLDKFFSLCGLLMFVPFGVAVCNGYEVIMWLLLVLVGYNPAEKPVARPPAGGSIGPSASASGGGGGGGGGDVHVTLKPKKP